MVIIYKVKQRKKSKSTSSGSLPKRYSYQIAQQVIPKKDTLIEEAEEIKDNLDELKMNKEILDATPVQKAAITPNSTLSEQKTLPTPESFSKKHESLTLNKKNTFDRYYWSFTNDQNFETKKLKFEKALECCKENNLGSKAKLRRLKMKLDRWNVENERDVEAMMPDYESLLDLIEEFENQ